MQGDGPAILTPVTKWRRGALVLLSWALLLASCSPNDLSEGSADSIDLRAEDGDGWDISELDLSPEYAADLVTMLARNRSEVPAELPESLLAVDKRPAMLNELLPGIDGTDSRLTKRLTVANVFATPFQGAILCIQDWEQVPCSSETATFQIVLPAWSAIQHTVSIPEAEDSVVFAAFLLKDDRRTIDSNSMVHMLSDPDLWDVADWAPQSAQRLESSSSFAGCGFPAFVDADHEGDPQVLDRFERDARIAIAMDICPDYGSPWLLPILARNRQELVDVDWASIPLLFDRSIQFPVPARVVEDETTESLQFFLFMSEDGDLVIGHAYEIVLE